MGRKKRIAVYPGTFDPITKGHIDLTRRALPLFDEIVMVVAENPKKKTLFTPQERVTFIRDSFRGVRKVKVMSYTGLIVDFMKRAGVSVIIRGLRAVTDFEYELQMVLTNRTLSKKVESVFFMPDARYIYLNSTVAKEVAQFGGKLSEFVTPMVARALRDRYGSHPTQ